MMRGVDILANAVRVTLGPKGRNVVLDKSYGAPRITKDGVTVAKRSSLKISWKLVAQMVREVASKSSDYAGDGTTTATVLAHAIVREGAKSVAAGMNPMDLKRGIDLRGRSGGRGAQEEFEKSHLQRRNRPGRHDFRQRRFRNWPVPCRCDEESWQRGRNLVERQNRWRLELEVVEGMQFDRGYISPYFITNAEEIRVEINNPYLLIYDEELLRLTGIVAAA